MVPGSWSLIFKSYHLVSYLFLLLTVVTYRSTWFAITNPLAIIVVLVWAGVTNTFSLGTGEVYRNNRVFDI